MSENKNIFGVNDTDEGLKGKSGGGKFGLNQANVSKLEFLDNAGKDGAAANAVDIWIQVGDREYRRRLYDDTGNALFGKKNVKVQPGEDGYDDLFFDSMGQKIAVIKHTLKAVGVSQGDIDKVSATLDPANIGAGMKALVDLVPAGFQKVPVDVFLEYQWEIQEDQDKTYPEVPKNMKGGRFLIPHVAPVGKWVEERSWTGEEGEVKGLRYKDDAGNFHPFDRDASFMEQNKGTQQFLGGSSAAAKAVDASAEKADKSTW